MGRDKYLAKNNGEANATTTAVRTVYYFEVSNEGFEKALDIFSQFFICPRFNEGTVEREMNAAKSEFTKNKAGDNHRLSHLRSMVTKKESNKFRLETRKL